MSYCKVCSTSRGVTQESLLDGRHITSVQCLPEIPSGASQELRDVPQWERMCARLRLRKR